MLSQGQASSRSALSEARKLVNANKKWVHSFYLFNVQYIFLNFDTPDVFCPYISGQE